MAKPNVPAPSPTAWGTLEDLLLAFAVNRHGTAAWESIASELRKRSADPSVALTPQTCRLKYIDLKRRFSNAAPNHDLEDDENKSDAAPLLEELRKLRVAELRREVQRYNLNIESLELKVKKMKEEREQSDSLPDLEKKIQGNICAEPPEATAGEAVPEEDLEKDQLSVHESNSTDLAAEKLKTGEKDPEPIRTGKDDETEDRTGPVSEGPAELKSEPDRKSIPEDSCNGSSNSIEEPDRKNKGEPENDSTGLTEPDTVSDGGGEEPTKENSDVQSSVSRSKKKKENIKVRREKTSGDEREREDQSRAVKDLSAESQPLIDFLQSIRAHKFGSVFERRLRSQETSRYQKLVLQHIDFQTIKTRLKEGWYSVSTNSFFRDLLLLVNNALIFFGKKSAEGKAAAEIRQLITKEISEKNAKSNSSASRKQVSLKSLSMSKKEPPEPPQSLTLKPRISNSLIVCRKRSSIAAKAAAAAEKRKEEKDTKQHSQQSGSSEEPKITKKRTRDRLSSIPTAINTQKNSKTQSKNSNKNSISESGKQQGKGGPSSSSQPADPKSENKKNQPSTLESKRRGAANFLNRMKQGSLASNNGSLVDALKNRPLTSESTSTCSKAGGSSEVKKNENPKRGQKKEAAVSKAKQKKEKDKGSPVKRNVGRPPKRGAAATPTPVLGKRVREKAKAAAETEIETETPPPRQAKKRTRKL